MHVGTVPHITITIIVLISNPVVFVHCCMVNKLMYEFFQKLDVGTGENTANTNEIPFGRKFSLLIAEKRRKFVVFFFS